MVLPYFLSELSEAIYGISGSDGLILEGVIRVVDFSWIYSFGLQHGRYTEDVYVSWGRAQVYQLH